MKARQCAACSGVRYESKEECVKVQNLQVRFWWNHQGWSWVLGMIPGKCSPHAWTLSCRVLVSTSQTEQNEVYSQSSSPESQWSSAGIQALFTWHYSYIGLVQTHAQT